MGLVRYHVFFVIRLATRKVQIAGIVPEPHGGWMKHGAQALSYLKRFGSVTILNGHVHQTMKKIEGRVTFHNAMSTTFPQPEPGITDVNYVERKTSLAIVDSSLV